MKLDTLLFLSSFAIISAIHLLRWIIKLNFKYNFKEKTQYKLPFDAAQLAKREGINVINGFDFFISKMFNKFIIDEEVISGNTIYDYIYVLHKLNDNKYKLTKIKIINNYFASLTSILFIIFSWYGQSYFFIGLSVWCLSIFVSMTLSIISYIKFKKEKKHIYVALLKEAANINEIFREEFNSCWKKVMSTYFWTALTPWNQNLKLIAELLYARSKHYRERKM